MNRYLLSLLCSLVTGVVFAQWTPRTNGNESFVLYAMPQIAGVDVTEEDDVQIGAFFNDVCLGVASYNSVSRTVGGNTVNIPYYELRAWIDDVDGEPITGQQIEIRALYKDVEYTFNKTFTAEDNKVYGTLSNLEHLVFYPYGSSFVKIYTPILFDLDDETKTEIDLRDVTYFVSLSEDGEEDVIKLSEMDSYPSNLVYEIEGEGEYFTLDGWTLTALKPTSVMGKKLYVYMYHGNESGEPVSEADVIVYPIKPLLKNFEVVPTITLNRDRDESEDLLENIKYTFYEGFADEACTDTIVNSYYADELEGDEKYELPQLSLSYDKGNAYFHVEDFVVKTDQTKKYREVDTPEILKIKGEATGDFPGFSQDIEVYVTPVKYLIRELTLPILTVEKGKQLNLLDKLVFRVVSGYYRLATRTVSSSRARRTTEEYYWIPCDKNTEAEKRIEVSELPEPSADLLSTVFHLIKDVKATDDTFFAPEITWTGFDQNGTITNHIFNATTPTSILGVKVTAKIDSQVYDPHVVGAKVSSTLFVTPFSALLNGISIPEELPYIDVEKGGSVDVADYVLYTFVEGKDEDGNPITVSYTKAELEAANIPVPELVVTTNNYAISAEGSVITGVGSTDINGVTITIKDGSNSSVTTKVTVRVTPFAYEIKSIEIDSPLSVDINETLNLKDKIKFTVVIDEEGTEAVKTLADADWTAPTIEWAENTEYFRVSYNDVLTPKQRTLEAGVSGLQATIRSSIYQGEGERLLSLSSNVAVVQITPLLYPVTAIELVPSSEKACVGSETITLAVNITPENGEFDEEMLSIFSDYGTIEKGEEGWFFTATKVGTGAISFTYEDEYASLSGQISMQIGYKYELAQGWNWNSYFMLKEGGYSVTAFDELLGGTEESHLVQDIRSQEEVASIDETEGYFGSLSEVFYNNMYKAKLSGAGSFEEYDASQYNASEATTATLKAGWTWVAYPYQAAYSIETLSEAGAFDAFASDVQIVTLEDNFVQYTKADESWSSTSFTFRPGQGYMVYTETSTTISWPAESSLSEDNGDAAMSPSSRSNSVLRYDVHAFRDVMPVIATLKNISDFDGISIGAFVDGECRGEGYVATVCGEQKLFITVHGKAGEVVTFKGYDGAEGFDISGKVEFANMAGTVEKPVELKADVTSGISEIATEAGSVMITDLTGKRVASDINQLPAGTYIIITDGKASKVVVK